MATQNFRVKNGLEVGSATTITSTDAFIGGNLSVTGVTTFQGQVNIEGPIITDGGASLGEDVVTRNLYSSGVSTFIGAISGSSASFSGDVTVGGVLKYEDVVNVDSIGIATARSGLRITDGGLDVVGVSTFSNSIDANGDLDVDGHTELDNLNVSGVSTFVGVSTFQDKVVFDSTNSIQIPAGDTSQRDPSPVAGQIRYNSQLSSFEGYGPGNAWGSLGGVKDVNQDTYIIPESSAGSNEDILYFYNAGSNTATISSTTATVNVDLSVTGVSTFTGNIDANGDLDVDGHTELDNVNVSGFLTATSATFSGDVTIGGELKYEDVVNVDSIGIATARSGLRITGGGLDVVGVSTFNNSIDANGDLDVDGHTELDNLNVSGVSTFVGIVTSQSNVFVGNDLSVAGDARIVGVLTVGSGTITIDGDSNTINVGTGATLHTTTVSVNQLEVAGLSTFAGIGTFQNNLFVGGTLYTPEIILNGSSLGEDIETRNISASGIVTVTGTTDLNGDLDVDGHTELDNLNVSGVSTFSGIGTFSSDLYVGGDLDVDGNVNFNGLLFQNNSPFIASYWVQTGAGIHTLGSVGVGTTNPVGSLEVSGHTELDNLNVSGVSTFQDNVNLGDNDSLYFGDNNDLQIVHNGTNSVLYHSLNSGYLSLRSNASTGGIHFYDTDSSTYWGAMEAATGAVNFNYNGSKKFETTAGGIDVTGTTDTDQLNVTGVSTFTGDIDANGNLDVDGHAEFDNVNISGVGTVANIEIGSASNNTINTLSGALTLDSEIGFNVAISTHTNVVGYLSATDGIYYEIGDFNGPNGIAYFDSTGLLVSSASTVGAASTSNYLLTTNASGVPVWTNVFDGGSF